MFLKWIWCFAVMAIAQVDGAWKIAYDGSQEDKSTERGGRVSFTPSEDRDDSGFDSFAEVMEELKVRERVSSLRHLCLGIIKDDDFNKRLVEALQEGRPKEFAKVTGGVWVDSDMQALSRELKVAVLSLEEFKGVEERLAEFGLEVRSVSTEKFSFQKNEGKTRVFGMGIWVSIEPIDYNMGEGRSAEGMWFSLSELFQEEGRWVGVFNFSPRDENDVRIYGRWSAENKMYVVRSRRLGWAEGNGWGSSAKLEFGEKEISFRIKKGTSHSVRIDLGETLLNRAGVKIYGPGFSVLSEDFVLSEQSHAFRKPK